MSHREPIAIVGIGCRYPGVSDVESFWRVLRDGIETVGEYPGNRFDSIDRAFSDESLKRGLVASRRGGFLPDLDQFDAAFFGISPREADQIDPQQRLLLEVAYEAAEDAGMRPDQLAGSRTGIFVGLWNSDYERCIFDLSRNLDFYATTGGGRYPASGRLAYMLDVRGPNLTVDTACSSSLVAIHLACASLRSGESEMALAGGVNAILQPEITLAYSAAKMLSPEGRCKFGDAAADGYVRSEGAGIVFLKTLSRAKTDGDAIYAVIRGSAVNNDGRSSGSLIAPSREGQEQMLRTALQDAALEPADVDYIEAHGTGTLAGDPVEIEAIGAVVAEKSRQRPCTVGSVKTNLGHTESAAGVAGVIKVALSLERRTLPASLHFHKSNPRIRWSEGAVAIQARTEPWPAGPNFPVAGVSGFGITGTNAHVVLQGVPAPAEILATPEAPRLFMISAHTATALEARAASWRDRMVADPAWPASLADLAYTAGARRGHHSFRLAIIASTRQELLDKINAWLAKQEQAGARSGKTLAEEKRRAVFVFPGQGGQWIGMGQSLLRDSPVFREALAQCDAAIRKYTSWTVTERLRANDAESGLNRIEVIQPVLFGVMVALAALWRSLGVEPEAVVGHSMGEAAAAAVCGALSLEDAAAVICHRSRLMQRASGRGLMAVAELSLADAEKFAHDYAGRISVAANNSPTSTVLSGDADAIEDALRKLEAREIFCRRIKVDVASHSAHMEPFREELAQELKNIRPRKSSVPLYSTTTGAIEDGTGLNPDYWSRNLRQPVLFSTAMQSLLRDGFDTFVEINAHPVLLQAIEDGIRHAEKDAVAVASLRREKDELPELLDALGALYVSGFPVKLDCLYPQGACVRLPTYPWQRERHWMEADSMLTSRGRASGAHPSLGMRISSSIEPSAFLWEADLRPAAQSHQTAHLIHLALAAASDALASDSLTLSDLEFSAAAAKSHAGQVVIAPAGPACWSLRISAQTELGWTVCCQGMIRKDEPAVSVPPLGEAREETVDDLDRDPLSECLKLAASVADEKLGEGPYRVGKIKQLTWHADRAKGRQILRAALEGSADSAQANCRIQQDGGDVLSDISGIQFGPANAVDPADLIYQLDWVPMDPTQANSTNGSHPPKSVWILVGDSGAVMTEITRRLRAQGDDCLCIFDADAVQPALESAGSACHGIICLPRAKGPDPLEAQREALGIVQVVQALAAGTAANPPRLWILTCGAWALRGDSSVSPAGGPLWGLGRVIAREHPELRGTNVDLPEAPTSEDFDRLIQLLRHDNIEEQIALRANECLAGRLKRHPAATSGKTFSPKGDATYLITGGMGGIGVELAGWLVSLGARHLALVGRRQPSAAVQEKIVSWETSGAEVKIINADVSDADQMHAAFATIAKQMPPLRGILHLAVATDGCLLTDLNAERLNGVMRPKAGGAWTLHTLSKGLDLDIFVLFSSVACILSQPGQASYAAANSYVDALARARRTQGLAALSVQYGPWTGTGLAKDEGALRSVRAYQAQGIGTLQPSDALETLSRLICENATDGLVLPVRWDRFARSLAGDKAPRPFEDLVPKTAAEADKQSQQESIREKLLAALPGRSRRTALETHLQETLAAVLKADASRLDPTRPMGALGVDSLMALQFVRRLATSTSVALPATAVFNYPTLRSLATELARRMGIPLDAEAAREQAPAPAKTQFAEPSNISELTEEETIRALLGGVKP